jgi:hypothetical protein
VVPGEGARTGEESAEALDGELDDSLSKFDRLLLRERETLADNRAGASASGAGGTTGGVAAGAGAGAGGETGESGSEDGGAEDGGADSSGETSGAETTGDSTGAPAGAETVETGPQGEAEDHRDDRVPADIPDASGDDVVARQLREAAMAEDDPELREKLWEEYRRYKGIGGKSAKPAKDEDGDGKAGDGKKKEGGGEQETG